MIGETLSHYEITGKLGEGGMGVVYKARDSRLNRDVAVKVLPAGMVANAERRRRFVQEAQAASALNHPNIITIYDIGSENGTDFMVMEYVPGKSLDQVIPGKGLPLREALQYAVQIADAMAAAHGAGILHRDLKPGNVMVTEDGRVKVLDFGLAKLIERSVDSELDASTTVLLEQKPMTVKGAILRTVSYMSPEQAEGKELDTRSDIFSFGAVLYEVLTGRRAFSGGSVVSTLAAILNTEPRPMRSVPRDVAKLVARCLKKDRSKRYQTMADLKVSLEELIEDPGTQAPAVAPKPASPLRWVALVLTAIALVAVGWFVRPESISLQQLLSPLPLTTYPGREDFPSFSPDGNQVAFSWNGKSQDNFDIYVQVVGAGSPVRLTSDAAVDYSPAWSPDGRHIAFLRESEGGRAAVILIPALGGAERHLTEVSVPLGMRYAPGTLIDWFPDSRRLVICDGDSSADTRAASLFALDTETSERWQLTSPAKTSRGDFAPAVSANGRTVAFVRTTGDWQRDVHLLSVSPQLKPEGEPRRITGMNRSAASPAWGRDGNIFFLAGAHGGQRWLWRVAPKANAAPEKLLPVSTETRRLASSGVALGSRWRLALPVVERDENIWRLDIGVGGSDAGSPQLLISSTRLEENPQFSPDGQKISFISQRSGSPEVWACDADGANPVQLTSFPDFQVWGQRWSPDGEEVAFAVYMESQRDIYVISAGGSTPRRLTVNPGMDGGPCWSRNGQWIYYNSNRTGTFQIWRIPDGGGDAIQVTIGGGTNPVESPDGRFVYYARSGTDWRASVWRVPTGGGEEAQVIESVPTVVDFAVTEDGIYFLDGEARGSGSVPLRFLDFASNKVTTISTALKEARWGLTVSPDGRSVLVAQFDRYESDLVMLEFPE